VLERFVMHWRSLLRLDVDVRDRVPGARAEADRVSACGRDAVR
jgi:hypothetical protein